MSTTSMPRGHDSFAWLKGNALSLAILATLIVVMLSSCLTSTILLRSEIEASRARRELMDGVNKSLSFPDREKR